MAFAHPDSYTTRTPVDAPGGDGDSDGAGEGADEGAGEGDGDAATLIDHARRGKVQECAASGTGMAYGGREDGNIDCGSNAEDRE